MWHNQLNMKQNITLHLDTEAGLTLKTLYDICIFAEENYKELRGIRPLQRVEVGIGFPRKPGDSETYYKAKLYIGWNRGRSVPQYCRWNMIIPTNWKDELPGHRLFNASVSNTRPKITFESCGAWEDRMKEMERMVDSFACYQGDGLIVKRKKIIVTLDCTYEGMPPKMFDAFKNALKDLGYIQTKC